MRALITILLFVCAAFSAFSQFQQPLWEMPIYFEDAEGAKDTIWFGYDPKAEPLYDDIDTIFDEDYKKIIDSSFHAYIDINTSKEIRTRNIIGSPQGNVKLGVEIGFIRGKLPLIISWDRSKLDAPNMPFPTTNPPYKSKLLISNSFGLCEVINAFGGCGTHGSYIIYNDPTYSPKFLLECLLLNDSLILSSPDNNKYTAGTSIGFMNISIQPLSTVGISEPTNSTLKLFPNPFRNELNIELEKNGDYQIFIFDFLGHAVSAIEHHQGNSKKTLNLGYLSTGIYYLSISNNIGHETFKVIKY